MAVPDKNINELPMNLFIPLGDIILQSVLLACMVCFHKLQFRHLYIQIHLFLDVRIACRQSLHLCIGQRGIVDILTASDRRFARHDLPDELLLVLDQLPAVGIKCPFRDIP